MHRHSEEESRAAGGGTEGVEATGTEAGPSTHDSDERLQREKPREKLERSRRRHWSMRTLRRSLERTLRRSLEGSIHRTDVEPCSGCSAEAFGDGRLEQAATDPVYYQETGGLVHGGRVRDG